MHPGANGDAIVSGVLGRLSNGAWFFYKDPRPSNTNTTYPILDGPSRVHGGSFHGEYVGFAFEDLGALLIHMDKRDVDATARKMQVRSAVIRRASMLPSPPCQNHECSAFQWP